MVSAHWRFKSLLTRSAILLAWKKPGICHAFLSCFCRGSGILCFWDQNKGMEKAGNCLHSQMILALHLRAAQKAYSTGDWVFPHPTCM